MRVQALLALREQARALRVRALAQEHGLQLALCELAAEGDATRAAHADKLARELAELCPQPAVDEAHALPESLKECADPESFVNALREVATPIAVPARWAARVDTSRQDAKDIERDAVELRRGEVISGAEARFDGVLQRLIADIESASAGEADADACERFARALLNAVNRTCSGGDALDVLEKARPDCVRFRPDTTAQLEPLRVEVAGASLAFVDAARRWDFGVTARVQASVRFLVSDAEHAREYAAVRCDFERRFGMGLVAPRRRGKDAFALGEGVLRLTIVDIYGASDF